MTPAEYMAKAARALASARLLLDDRDVEGACNRAYYAMFDAARAALIWSGAEVELAETKTHRGMIAAFGRYLVKPGLLPVDLGKSLNQVERVRLLADYLEEGIDPEKACWAVERAAAFVEAVRTKFDRSAP